MADSGNGTASRRRALGGILLFGLASGLFVVVLQLGVVFQMEPTETGPVTIATFEDTCGNLIRIVQQ